MVCGRDYYVALFLLLLPLSPSLPHSLSCSISAPAGSEHLDRQGYITLFILCTIVHFCKLAQWDHKTLLLMARNRGNARGTHLKAGIIATHECTELLSDLQEGERTQENDSICPLLPQRLPNVYLFRNSYATTTQIHIKYQCNLYIERSIFIDNTDVYRSIAGQP